MKPSLDNFFQIVITMFSRGISAIGALLFIFVVSNLSGTSVVGVTAVLHSIVIGLSLLCVFGMGRLVMRVRSSEKINGHNLFQSALRLLLFSSLLPVIFLTFLVEEVAYYFIDDGYDVVYVFYILSFPAIAIGMLISGYLKGCSKPSFAVLYENGFVYLSASLILIILNLVNQKEVLFNIGFSFFISSWFVAIAGLFHTRAKIWVGSGAWKAKTIYSESRYYFGTDITNFLQNNALFIVAGYTLDSSSVGVLRIIERMASLISFGLITVNAVYAQKFSSLFYSGNLGDLSKRYKESVLSGFSFGAPFFLIYLIFYDLIFESFGVSHELLKEALWIYSSAALFNALTGSVALLLSVSDEQRFVYYCNLVISVISIGVFWVISDNGLLFCVYVMSASLVVKNFLMLSFLVKKFGISFILKK